MVTLAQSKVARFFPGELLGRTLLFAVPSLSARTLGLYRILFGSIFLIFFWVHVEPGRLATLAESGSQYYLNSLTILSDLSAEPRVRSALYYSVILFLCLFVAGLFTRLAYIGLAVAYCLIGLLSGDGHSVTPLLLALLVTVNARWGAALSLDRLLFRRAAPMGRSPEFGYPIWLMGLCICLAYTSAGISKIYLTGGAWIWEGGARWGFMVDMDGAATLWGPIFINDLPLAILASVFSAFGQIAYIYSCFTRNLLIKSAIGLFIALPFLGGLVLFMGLFWWPWFTLVALWYLPWTKIDELLGRRWQDTERKEPAHAQRNWATGAAVVLLFGHGYVVAKGIEIEPLFSNYPMYVVALPMGSEEEDARWQDHVSRNPDFVYAVSVETVDGRVTDISQRYRGTIFLDRVLKVPSLYRRAGPREVWNRIEEGETSDQLCRLQREVLARVDSDARAANLVYQRRHFDLEDGKIVWSSKGKSLRVTVTADNCSYVWAEDET